MSEIYGIKYLPHISISHGRPTLHLSLTSYVLSEGPSIISNFSLPLYIGYILSIYKHAQISLIPLLSLYIYIMWSSEDILNIISITKTTFYWYLIQLLQESWTWKCVTHIANSLLEIGMYMFAKCVEFWMLGKVFFFNSYFEYLITRCHMMTLSSHHCLYLSNWHMFVCLTFLELLCP